MNVKFSIGRKIGFVFLLFLFLSVGQDVLIYNHDQKRDLFLEELHKEIEELNSVHNLKMSLIELVMPVNDFLIVGADPNETKNFEVLTAKVSKMINFLSEKGFDEENENVLFEQLISKFTECKKTALKIFAMPNAIGNPEAGRLMEEADQLSAEAVKLGEKMQNLAYDKVKLLEKKLEKAEQLSHLSFLIENIFYIFIMAVSFYFTRQLITLPILSLKKSVSKISSGDFSEKVNIKTNDEVGELGSAFNEMVDKLKNSREEVLVREKELSRMLDDLQTAHNDLKDAQNQLVQSERMASIGQLAAGVAHEINNPVGFIGSNLQSLEEYIKSYTNILFVVDKLKKSLEHNDINKAKEIMAELKKVEKDVNLDFIMNDVADLLQESRGGIERIKKIVLDLRTFSREDEGEKGSAKIESVIDSVLSIVQNEIKYKAELIKEYGETPKIKCYAQKLGQVFVNLLINASHAIKEKGEIRIKTYQEKNYVCVEISDNGKGIAEEDLNKIFDPFYTTKAVGEGTGLGLSISYEIVKKQGGEMTVGSELGKGTTFKIRLPRG